MAKGSDGSGRIYMMVGLIASVVIPLALIAPGLSDQVADKDVRRLGPVEPEIDETDDMRPVLPDRARPVPTGGDSLPLYGEASDFGKPMMDPNAPVASNQLPQYSAPEDRSASSHDAPARTALPPSGTGTRSQNDADRAGAAAAGLPTQTTSRTISRPLHKDTAPPMSTQRASKLQ